MDDIKRKLGTTLGKLALSRPRSGSSAARTAPSGRSGIVGGGGSARKDSSSVVAVTSPTVDSDHDGGGAAGIAETAAVDRSLDISPPVLSPPVTIDDRSPLLDAEEQDTGRSTLPSKKKKTKSCYAAARKIGGGGSREPEKKRRVVGLHHQRSSTHDNTAAKREVREPVTYVVVMSANCATAVTMTEY